MDQSLMQWGVIAVGCLYFALRPKRHLGERIYWIMAIVGITWWLKV